MPESCLANSSPAHSMCINGVHHACVSAQFIRCSYSAHSAARCILCVLTKPDCSNRVEPTSANCDTNMTQCRAPSMHRSAVCDTNLCLQKHNKRGPMLFHHITRQPLSLGLSATEDLHRRIDREDQSVWQYWVTSLRQRMRQHTMSQEETHYIWRFEHYRFWLPHSANALVCHPSLPSTHAV
jgi:hypothetical protein